MNLASKSVVLGLLLTFSVATLPAFAVEPAKPNQAANQTTTPKESPFCTNLSATVSKVNTNVTNLKAKITSSFAQRDSEIASNRAKWDQEIKDNRAKWDKVRQDNFTKLETKAQTDAQKAAVKTYESAITNAVTTRRAAYDAARVTYRGAEDGAIAAKRDKINGQIANFTNGVNGAISTAQASCAATPSNGPAIRDKFSADMKAAGDTYSQDRKNDDIGSTLKQLAQTRNAAFAAADKTFDATAQAARDALKAAFKGASI